VTGSFTTSFSLLRCAVTTFYISFFLETYLSLNADDLQGVLAQARAIEGMKVKVGLSGSLALLLDKRTKVQSVFETR